MERYLFDAVIFDLDGVITKTAVVHAKAWKTVFDGYLRLREGRDGEPFREFTHEGDYLKYVDGKPRYQGVRSFLGSRGVTIPFGEPSDPADRETVCGIGNKKNDIFRKILEEQGAEVYGSTVRLVKKLKELGIRVGVASSSKNCRAILATAKLESLFETRVDGVESARIGLKGKPESDIFDTAARNLGAVPARSVVVEDATSGVQAGRNGGFGLVLGVARENNTRELLKNGADVVVADLADVTVEWINGWFRKKPVPLFSSWDVSGGPSGVSGAGKIAINPAYSRSARSAIFSKKRAVFFLDYDGSLTPIVERPELAVMREDMRDVVTKLSRIHTVAIVSGRMKEDVMKLVSIDGLFYAGSHGFDISGPGFDLVQPKARETIPVIDEVITILKKEVGSIPGALIEEKKFSVAVHYRLAKEESLPVIKKAVDAISAKYDALKVMSGKMVYEIMPDIDWDKGKAIRWIMNALKIAWDEASVIYVGDDVTDECAFRVVRSRGAGILVSEQPKASAADFWLSTPSEVRKLFEKAISSS
ncbi:MAG: trehalose-phosphatase [Candidatus Omnitrophota bacterium]